MSSYIYNSIFTLPIDLQQEDETNISKDNKIILNDDELISAEINIIDDNNNNISFISNRILDNDTKLSNDDTKNSEFITFSTDKNNKQIKSLSNSSRLYINEILKKNWKVKVRKLKKRLKQKLIKKINHIENEEKKQNIKNNNIESNFLINQQNITVNQFLMFEQRKNKNNFQ